MEVVFHGRLVRKISFLACFGQIMLTRYTSLFVSLYLVNLESTVITTSLFTITGDLQSFDLTSWIVTAYLITYTGELAVLKAIPRRLS